MKVVGNDQVTEGLIAQTEVANRLLTGQQSARGEVRMGVKVTLSMF